MLETMFKRFSVAELMRYGAAGGVSLFSFVATRSTGPRSLPSPLQNGGALVAFAFLLGLLLHAVHRAAWYPVWERLSLWLAVCVEKETPGSVYQGKSMRETFPLNGWWWVACPIWFPLWILTPNAIDRQLDKRRWARRAQAGDAAQGPLSDWGSHIHFLYAAALGIWLSIILPPRSTITTDAKTWIWIATTLHIAALVANYRLKVVEGSVAVARRPTPDGRP